MKYDDNDEYWKTKVAKYTCDNAKYHRRYRETDDFLAMSGSCSVWQSGFNSRADSLSIFSHGLVGKNWILF